MGKGRGGWRKVEKGKGSKKEELWIGDEMKKKRWNGKRGRGKTEGIEKDEDEEGKEE